MNVVTGPAGVGEAVLLRALTPVAGASRMAERRGSGKGIANGPGKLTQALGIGIEFDGRDFFSDDLKIVDPGRRLPRGAIATSPRIGITKAADLPLRFYLWASPDISRPLASE
jgi:DNA-3-methyladenine glycosylase